MAYKKFTLNLNNIYYIVFHKKYNVPQALNSVHGGDTTLTQKRCTRFLGITIDEHLHWGFARSVHSE